MKFPRAVSVCSLTVAFSVGAMAADLTPTFMTKRGKQLVDEDFSKPFPPPKGSTAQFASGFQGWRFNAAKRGLKWELVDGTLRGTEQPENHHPATVSYGFDFKDVVIQCDVCFDDVPLDPKKYRSFSIRTTDTKDYVCSIVLTQSGMRIQKDDNDHGGPDKAVPLGQYQTVIKPGEWQTVTFEILGDEMVGTLNGHSLTGRHPLITSAKHSIMFVSSGVGSVRNFKVWEALPNPDWKENQAKILAGMKPAKTAAKK